jgi:hypothetical protein
MFNKINTERKISLKLFLTHMKGDERGVGE